MAGTAENDPQAVHAPVAPARLAAWAGSLVRMRRRGEGRVGEATYPAVTATTLAIVGLVVFAIAALRNPLLWRSQFVSEEAAAYWAMSFAQDPIRFLFDPWIGYLQVVSRAGYLVARAVPLELAPAFTRALEDAIVAGVALFVASGRLAGAIPDARVRIAFGLSLALLPSPSAYGSILQAHWILAVLVVALSLTDDRRWYDYPLGVVAILSGLPAALAVPVFWLRRPDKLGLLLTGIAGIQLALAMTSGRRQDLDLDGLVARVDWAIVVVPLLIAAAWRRVPFRPALALSYLGVATMLAGAAASRYIHVVTENDRYFVAAWIAIAFVAIAAAARRSIPGILLLLVLAGAAVLSMLRPNAIPDTSWPTHADCIGGSAPCVVPMYPDSWSVTWPGDPALYEQPAVPKF